MGSNMIWVQKDGTKIEMSEMTDTHLKHALALVERKISRVTEEVSDAWGFAGSCRGEMASYYAEGAASNTEQRLASLVRLRDGLQGEINSRKALS